MSYVIRREKDATDLKTYRIYEEFTRSTQYIFVTRAATFTDLRLASDMH